MLLYGNTSSGHSYKIRSFLLLSGTPHDYQWIDLDLPRAQRPLAFTAISKFGEVPVLVDEGRVMCQSNAILIYLAQKTKQFCGDGSDWQTVLEWLSWEANRIGFSLPNLRHYTRRTPQPPDVMHYLRERMLIDLKALNAALSASEFLVPSGPSIADISCAGYIFWLADVGIDEASYPNVQRWLARLRALPGWKHPDEAMKP